MAGWIGPIAYRYDPPTRSYSPCSPDAWVADEWFLRQGWGYWLCVYAAGKELVFE